jgi:di/tricarboxylate transporter
MALSRSPRESVSSALRETAVHDTLLVLAVLATGFLGLPMVTGFDRLRWHPLPPPTSVLAALGLLLIGSRWTIKTLALRATAFVVAVVRIQREHVVVVDMVDVVDASSSDLSDLKAYASRPIPSLRA